MRNCGTLFRDAVVRENRLAGGTEQRRCWRAGAWKRCKRPYRRFPIRGWTCHVSSRSRQSSVHVETNELTWPRVGQHHERRAEYELWFGELRCEQRYPATACEIAGFRFGHGKSSRSRL